MRKVYVFLQLLVTLSCFSQNKQILYNFTSVPQSMMTNPGADVNYKFYFGVPLLSGFSTSIGSSGFSAYDLFANNGVDFNTKLRDVIANTSSRDKMVINEQIEIFSGGFKVGDWENSSYISFGMYQELDMIGYVPKDIAILALYGNKDYIGKSFNLGDLKGKAEMLSVLHFGFHKNIKENLIFGARAKIYSSAFNVTSTQNSGFISTEQGNATIYNQTIYSNLELKTSGISEYIKKEYNGDPAADIKKKMLFGGDLGLGFDAGVTYYPKKHIQMTASVIDLGFIGHSKEVETFTYKGYYEYEGINPNFNSSSTNTSFQEFKDAIPLDTIYDKYTTWRPLKLNASYQYSFGDSRGDEDCNCGSYQETKYKNALGGQLFMMSAPRSPMMALTAYYSRNLFANWHAKATYTIDSFSYANLGLGLSANIGAFNMYLMADNLLEYRDISKANSLSLQFGLNFIFKDNKNPF